MQIVSVRFSRCLLIAASSIVCGVVLGPAVGHAQVARLELHTIQSQTPTDQEFLTGKKTARPRPSRQSSGFRGLETTGYLL
jgi:hypothetical protein